MFGTAIVWYLNKVISLCEYMKRKIETDFEYLINTDINNTQLFKIPLKIKCTRKQRYMLYKKFKGKRSHFIIYSYGNEDTYTYKTICLKSKSY